MIKNHPGSTIISDVKASSIVFSEISNYFISGLIHVSDLGNDRYILNNDSNALVGKRTGKTYRIGQKIKVKLENVIPEERKLVLVPVKNDKKYK